MPDQTNTLWTRDEFLKRFTNDERVALHRAQLPDTPEGNAVALALQTFNAKSYIASSSPTLAATMQSLVMLGILTSERKAEILNPEV